MVQIGFPLLPSTKPLKGNASQVLEETGPVGTSIKGGWSREAPDKHPLSGSRIRGSWHTLCPTPIWNARARDGWGCPGPGEEGTPTDREHHQV